MIVTPHIGVHIKGGETGIYDKKTSSISAEKNVGKDYLHKVSTEDGRHTNKNELRS